MRIMCPLTSLRHTVDLLHRNAIVFGQFTIQRKIRIESVHDGMAYGRVTETEGMPEFMDGHIHKARATRRIRIERIGRLQ